MGEGILWAGGIAAALTAVYGLAVTLTRLGRRITAWRARGISTEVVASLQPRFDQISRELSANGGSTVKDVVIRLDEQTRKFQQYSYHQYNLARRERQAIRALIQIFHGDDFEGESAEVFQKIEELIAAHIEAEYDAEEEP